MLHVYRQITGLREFRPVVFCQKRENPGQFPFDELRVVPKPWSHQLRRLWQKSVLRRPITIYRAEARHLLASMEQIDARLLHIYFGHIGVHLLPLLELLAVAKPLIQGRSIMPAIVSFHGADADVGLELPRHRTALRRVFALATLLLVRSDSLAQRLREHGASPEKIRLHRTGIPLEEIPFIQRTAPQDGKWRLLQACRLIPKKGLATSLRAFADFRRAWPDAGLTVAGEGPELSKLRELAASLGISYNVHFPGFVQQEELRHLEAEAHIFLHPSEQGPDRNQEGVPNSILEAMASGLPVVATIHGGIPEAVEHGVTGFLVDERDHDSAARYLRLLSSEPSVLGRMSAASARKVRAEFDIVNQCRRLEEIYREAGSQAGAACTRAAKTPGLA
jgi:colanic acid/amylovoran biosynthesis glycosyltransferase